MPHKHTRRGISDASADLPPSVIARPLPVSKSASANGIFTTIESAAARGKKRKRAGRDGAADDTPKEFLRLMSFQQGKRLPKGLDDGATTRKKSQRRKPTDNVHEDASTPPTASTREAGPAIEELKIRPGERMSDFSARVDAALPVAGLAHRTERSGGRDPLGLKKVRTKTERKMHRMYAEWREQDRKLKEQREEQRELDLDADLDDEMAEDEQGRVRWKADLLDASHQGSGNGNGTAGKKAKKKARRKMPGELDDGEADPWAILKAKRGETGRRDINDVVQAPPTFTKLPTSKFRVRAGAAVEVDNVPRASGSLRKREELGEVRRSVVEGYRAMMSGRAA